MTAVVAEMSALVYQLSVPEGAQVRTGDVVAVLESMKMEIPVTATADGTVHFLVEEGSEINEGSRIAEIG